MSKRLLLPCLAAALTLSGGCSYFKKSSKPPEVAPTAETEDALRQRFVERRATELVAQGVAAEAARAQALAEFRAKYEFTGAAKK